MTSNGVNDASARTRVKLGFTIGASAGFAMESAGVARMKSDPYDFVTAIKLSHATLRKIHQNLWSAVSYNVIVLPLIAGVLSLFVLSPELAALSMFSSILLVAINALMLRRVRFAGITRHSSAQTWQLRSVEARP